MGVVITLADLSFQVRLILKCDIIIDLTKKKHTPKNGIFKSLEM